MTTKCPMPSQGLQAGQETGPTLVQSPPDGEAQHAIDNSQLPSPSPTIHQPPVAWKAPEQTSPDLGKFPAMRRRRGAGRKPRLTNESLVGNNAESAHSLNLDQMSATHANDQQGERLVARSDDNAVQRNGIIDSNTVQNSLPSEPSLEDRLASRLLAEMPDHSWNGNELSKRTYSTGHQLAAADTQPARSHEGPMQPPQARKHVDVASSVNTSIRQSDLPPAGVIWPDSKKVALATAAQSALTSGDVNAGKHISIGQIRTLLDTNPSYIELCERFEGMGFVFDRGNFARMLLAAVPDVNSSASAQRAASVPKATPLKQASNTTHPVLTAANHQALPAQGAQLPNRQSAGLGATENSPVVSPKRDAGLRPVHQNHLHSPDVPSGRLKQSPGRPRKDGTPAQPRKSSQLGPYYVANAHQVVSNHALSTTTQPPTGPGENPAPSNNSPGTEQSQDRHALSLKRDPSQSSTHLSANSKQSTDFGDPSQHIPSTNPITPSFRDQALQGTANAVRSSQLIGLEKGASVKQNISKVGKHLFGNQDPLRVSDVKSSGKEVSEQSVKVAQHDTANSKRGVASNLNANYLSQPQPYTSPYTAHKPPTPVALSKEDMARKRDFSEIVDLTQELSDEGDNIHQPSNKDHDIEALGTMSDGHVMNTTHTTNPAAVPGGYPRSGTNTPVTGGPSVLSRFSLATTGPLSQRNAMYMNIVKPLYRKDALRKSEYNAKTIARDVLIAAGRHPDMRPLNSHLDPLRKNFFAVEHNSDLSTFNWGIVDPKPLVDDLAGPDGSIHDADDEGDGMIFDNYETLIANAPLQSSRSRMLPREASGVEVLGIGEFFTVLLYVWAQIVLIALLDIHTPNSRNVNLLKKRDLLPHSNTGQRARTSGFGASETAKESAGRQQSSTSAQKTSNYSADAGRASGPVARDYVLANAGPGVTANARTQETVPASEITRTPEKKPRGRPPKSARTSSSTPSRGTQQARASSSKDGTDDETGKKRRGRPRGSKNPAIQSSNRHGEGQFSVPTRTKSSTTTTPTGSRLRNAASPVLDQPFAVVVGSSSSNANSGSYEQPVDLQRKRKSESREPNRGKRGRPSAASKAEPSYKVYKCQWKDCKAEIHNLETLRKHVRKLHRATAASGGIPCLWADCGRVKLVQDRKTGHHNRVHHHLDFGTDALWDEHMDKIHLEKLAWKLGDGPSAAPSG